MEQFPAELEKASLSPRSASPDFGKSAPRRFRNRTFLCHERSPTIPRINRSIATFLPDFPVKPVCNKTGVSVPKRTIWID